MQRDYDYIQDIIFSAKAALGYVENTDPAAFMLNDEKQHACISRLEIIGEAARRISSETRLKHDHLPWGEMIAMRNLLIHEYSRVDPEVVWKTVVEDLAELLITLQSTFPDLHTNQ